MDVQGFWKNFDLAGLQRDLERDAEEINRRRDEATASRKDLVQQSTEFRTSAPEDVRKKVAGLVKRFQTEVDMLSKRSVAAETAFNNIFQKLAVAPDPAPQLEAARAAQARLASVQELEVRNRKLQETLEEYRTEFSDLKNQDVTIKGLRDELKRYEERMEETVQTRVREKEKQLLRTFGEKERELQEQQLSMATRLGQAEHDAATLRAAVDATQSELLDARAHFEEELSARAAAMDMLERENEAAQQRAELLRKELEIERERLETSLSEAHRSSTAGPRVDALSLAALEKELQAKDRELSNLAEDHQALQRQFAAYKQGSDSRIAAMDVALHEKSDACAALEQRVRACADYDDIKRELGLVKSIEFGDGSAADKATDMPIEVLAQTRARQLQTETIGLREQLTQACERVTSLEEALARERAAGSDKARLIAILEGDLSSIKSFKSTEGPPEDLLTGGNSAPALSDTIIPIVASQRDRFKARNAELEGELRHAQQSLSALKNELDTMRSDNVKLYEKIKFLQGYQPTTVAVEGDEVVRKYTSEYEEHINPFRAFNSREKQRKVQNLSPAERIMLTISRTLLSSQYGRMFGLIYLLAIHLLIFVVLYKYSHVESFKRDVARVCLDKFASHMHEHNAQLPDELLHDPMPDQH
eukprot:m.238155 g.238155  ORF g.238155 m.238155 type:complete len:650 (+) comp21631_c0_seq1:7-1956(+)